VIAERAWWSRDDQRDGYGVGAAIRMRGGSDWELSSLLAESRLFVRVMRARGAGIDAIARTGARAGEATAEPGMDAITVTIGLGAAFGAGTPRYLERFRLHPFDLARP